MWIIRYQTTLIASELMRNMIWRALSVIAVWAKQRLRLVCRCLRMWILLRQVVRFDLVRNSALPSKNNSEETWSGSKTIKLWTTPYFLVLADMKIGVKMKEIFWHKTSWKRINVAIIQTSTHAISSFDRGGSRKVEASWRAETMIQRIHASSTFLVLYVT